MVNKAIKNRSGQKSMGSDSLDFLVYKNQGGSQVDLLSFNP